MSSHLGGRVGLGPLRATIRLTLGCNNRCAFCAQDGLAAEGNLDFDAALRQARALHDELTFIGGEPTLDDTLAAKVEAARALGFRRVGVQTNGSRLSDAAYATSLARAGLTDVHLSLLGGDARVHDYHTGRPGSFVEVSQAMRAAEAMGLPIVVTTVLTRSNMRVLGAIPPLLAVGKVAAWFISVPAIAGRAAAARDRMVPRLGLALPFALQALAAAEALAIPTFIVGAPLCMLGPFATHAIQGDARAYAPVCEACPARGACPGVDAEYLARFGGDELAPRDVAKMLASAKRDAPSEALDTLKAMFVGPGELAPVSVLHVADAPAARSRTSLPMLGKVKPAIAEAAAGTERRTGDALKEILPALFEGDPKP